MNARGQRQCAAAHALDPICEHGAPKSMNSIYFNGLQLERARSHDRFPALPLRYIHLSNFNNMCRRILKMVTIDDYIRLVNRRKACSSR